MIFLSLYLKSCKDIGIRKFEFVAKTQFLFNLTIVLGTFSEINQLQQIINKLKIINKVICHDYKITSV